MNNSVTTLTNPAPAFWYSEPLPKVMEAVGVDRLIGLTERDVQERRAVYGSNELPRGLETRWWGFLWHQFQSPLVYILLIAAALTASLREWADTIVILLSVFVNTLIGFSQEYHASRLLEKMKTIVRIDALVIRHGRARVVDAKELVPGDIIVLKTGSKVPADARLIEAHHLETNEAILTGESTMVSKAVVIVAPATPIGDRRNMVWLGTAVEEGAGQAVVVTTGGASELGRIAALAAAAPEQPTPLQSRLQHLANVISAIVAVSAVGIVALGILERLSFAEAFATAVAVAVAAVPEGLVAALSVVLAVSTARILRQQGLVRRPIAAETLGSTTVICTDKTGTLTEGVMKVEEFLPDGERTDALLGLALANEAILEDRNGRTEIHGKATDRAKLAYALDQGLDLVAATSNFPERALLPFDSRWKYLASFRRSPTPGLVRCFVSGTPEAIIEHSVNRGSGGELTAPLRQRALEQAAALAERGYRLIALGDRLLSDSPVLDNAPALRQFVANLTYRGLVAIRDPIRADVRETLKLTRQAGLRVMMMTGDHRLTARAIGRELGFRTGESNIMEGVTLEHGSDEDLKRAMSQIDLCVRVTPEHKLRVVKALRANGQAVAMTGDGINDAPALRASDIGVAVGSATDVTKEAADLVLLDDSLTTIVSAVREGRIAFDNIRKATILLVSGSFTAFLLVVTSLVLMVPLPLTAVQILWSNLVEHGLPTFALAFEPGEPDVMRRRPLRRDEPILRGLGNVIVFGIAPVRDLLLVGVFLWFYWYARYPLEHLRTIMFAMISVDSLFYVFSIKSLSRPLWRQHFLDNPYLVFSIGASLAMVAGALYLPALNRLLATVPLSAAELFLVVMVAIVDVVAIELAKLVYRQQ